MEISSQKESCYNWTRCLCVGLLILLAVVGAFSCRSSNDESSPDTDDGDVEEASMDPCQGAAVDCSPGSCMIEESHARCICPVGYVAVRYSCKAVDDGDLDDADPTEPEREIDDLEPEIPDSTEPDQEPEEELPPVVKTFSHPINRDDPKLSPGEMRITTEGKFTQCSYLPYDLHEGTAVYCNRGDLYVCDLTGQRTDGCYLYDVTATDVDAYYPSIYNETIAGVTYIDVDGETLEHLVLLNIDTLTVEFPLHDSSLHSIDHNDQYIVWNTLSQGIRVYDRSSSSFQTIELSRYRQNHAPIISGDLITWQWRIESPREREMMLHDLSTGETTNLTAGDPDEMRCHPVASSKRVVWVGDCRGLDNRDGIGFLQVQELDTGERWIIDPNEHEKNEPSMDEKRIAWTDLRNGWRTENLVYMNADIYLYDFDKDVVVQITSDPANQAWPRLDGRFVVYIDERWDYQEDSTAFDLCTLEIYRDDPMCTGENETPAGTP